MKSVLLASLDKDANFKKQKRMRARWFKRGEIIPYTTNFICSSASSNRIYEISGGTVVYVKD